MGYNVEISVNMLKETHFSEFENTIEEIAQAYNCESFYSISEEDGTIKIPRYHSVFVINFLNENFDNFIKFLRIIRSSKKGYIECIYDQDINKLLYASSYHLNKMGKEATKNYKNFIKNNNFTAQEKTVLKILMK
jgi:hypothetical protein